MVTTTLPGEAAQAQLHSSTSKLEDQAATAALYVTGNKDKQLNNNASANGRQFLDSDNKLSSAGAAASLKYAKPEDLPSYPTSGLKKNDSAAGAAASLGWANQKSFEHWKPDPSASASAAAMLAKDYKPAPMWKPEQSAAGAKAAVLANRDGAKVEIWKPEVNSWGNSAANQAFKKDRAGALSPQLDYGHTSLGRQGSLIAATGAMRNMNRKRSESTPVPVMPETYPDESNATANALRAATSAARKRTEQHSEGGSVPFTNMSRNMYTSHPPVAPEVEEKNRADVLHASAVAMAQGMYKLQQKQFEQTSSARSAANAAHGQRGHVRSNSTATSTADEELAPMRFNNLQEAAQRLAQERLSKLYGDHDKNRDYREYYGSSLPSSRMSIRGRPRRRASSDGDLVEDDRAQSNKIRQQMSLFSNKLSEVDKKKRQQDRENLIAVAQRNVTKSLHGMDEKVFADTGKVAPSLLNEWEVKAHAAAQSKSDTRMEDFSKDKSRVHIGKGVFIDQSAVDLVAARNVQPVLDEINNKAEKERVRQAELKLEQENQQRKAAETKAHEKEKKDINKKLKQQDKEERKMKEDEEKAERKAKENEEKAAKVEEKRLAKEKRKSTTPQKTEVPAPGVEDKAATETAESPTTATTIADRREGASTPAPIRTSMEMQAEQRMKENADAANKGEITPLSPTSSPDGSKVKNWLKTKFRRSSRGQKSKDEGDKGFVGGAAYTGATFKNTSSTSINRKSDSVRDVALAGKTEIEQEVAPPSRTQTPHERPTSEVSSVSSLEDDGDEFEEARDNFDEGLAPPPTFPTGPAKSSSPVRDSRFKEAI